MKNWGFLNQKKLVNFNNPIALACLIIVGLTVNHHWVEENLNTRIMDQRKGIVYLEENMNRKINILQKVDTIERQWQSHKNYYQQNLSEEEQLSDILSHIEIAAQSAHILLFDRKPQKVDHVDSYNVYSVEIVLECEMKNLVEFLYFLQHEPYLFDIDQLRLERHSSQGSLLKCFLVVSRIMIPS